jgi:hypothetical protein
MSRPRARTGREARKEIWDQRNRKGSREEIVIAPGRDTPRSHTWEVAYRAIRLLFPPCMLAGRWSKREKDLCAHHLGSALMRSCRVVTPRYSSRRAQSFEGSLWCSCVE